MKIKHLLIFSILANNSVQFFDQLQSVLVHFANENADYRTSTVLATVAKLLTSRWAGDVGDIERCRELINLQT